MTHTINERLHREALHRHLSVIAADCKEFAPVPPSVVAFVREWINTEPLDELLRWGFCRAADGDGVRFERVDHDRDDSVSVFADRFEYHFFARDEWYPSRNLLSAYVELDREPPHALRELSVELPEEAH